MKIQKKKIGGGCRVGGGRGKGWGCSAWGVRVDVNEEFKFFVKIHKKWGVGWGVGLGGGGGGQGGCETEELKFL